MLTRFDRLSIGALCSVMQDKALIFPEVAELVGVADARTPYRERPVRSLVFRKIGQLALAIMDDRGQETGFVVKVDLDRIAPGARYLTVFEVELAHDADHPYRFKH